MIPLVLSALAFGGGALDAQAWCDAVKARTVQIKGVATLFQGDTDKSVSTELLRLGSGFWVKGQGMVVTAEHVVKPLTEIQVCEGPDASPCHPVTGVWSYPFDDVAILWTDHQPAKKLQMKLEAVEGPGEPIVIGGYPGNLGFVCGTDQITGFKNPKDEHKYALVTGDDFAKGSSGGPVVHAKGSKPKSKVAAVGVVHGFEELAANRFGLIAPITSIDGEEVPQDVAAWRAEQPWKGSNVAELTLTPNQPYWEDIPHNQITDMRVEIEDGDKICYGFYVEGRDLVGQLANEPIEVASACGKGAVLVTALDAGVLKLSLWNEGGDPWTGKVTFSLR